MCDEIYKTFDFLKEKIQKRKINFVFFLFFPLLLLLARKNVFIQFTLLSLSLSLYYIYKKTLNDKKKE